MRAATLLLSSLLCFFAADAKSEDSAANRDATAVTKREGEPEVRDFRGDDREMNEAMSKARASLSTFEQRLKQPPATQTYIGLKVRFEEDGHIEHMWIDEGSAVQATRAQVSDWMAVDAGKLVGGYTVRVQRARMSPGERTLFDESFGVEF